jgi:hypothetical protein
MQMSKALFTAVTLLMTAGAVSHIPLQATTTQGDAASQKSQGNNFYCNVKALSPAERASHKQLTDKLVAARNKIVETPKGYEFQFSPSAITIAELADWVAKEGKCCPFFDFHIDLEEEGHLLCLRLTGADGIKAFVRQEFQVTGDK